MRFYAEIDGAVEMDRAFNRIEGGIDDLRPIWPEVIREVYSIEAEQYGSEGSVGASGKWAALSKAYAAYKAVKFPGQPILRATGSLFDSMTNPEAPGAVFKPERSDLTIGTSIPYARYHQRGTRRMPSRPPFSLSESQKRRVQKAIQIGLVAFVRKQGFQVLEKAA